MYSVDQDTLDQTYISPSQMARETGTPPQTINYHLRNSKLKFVLIGGHRMYFRGDWDVYLKTQRSKGNLLPKKVESANGHA